VIRKRKHAARSSGRSLVVNVALLALVIGTVAVAIPAVAFPNATDESQHVTFTLEGCRNNGGIVLPNGSGDFICVDPAYTTGNLGKGWNELDLVPHRLTTQLGTQSAATTDYKVTIAADGITNGNVGYDVISEPEVNAAKSDPSCTVSADSQTPFGDAANPFGGGTDTVIYRDLTIHQNTGTKCVFDYHERLALGSHLYPGSSLQSYTFPQANLSGSEKKVSIPVNEILPQELRKDMTATQGSKYAWNVTKGATPGTLSFGDVCAAGSTLSKDVDIEITWTRLPASPSGDITVITNIYAKNPASRVITVNVTDVIKSGATVLDTASSGAVDVAANTELKVLTHTTTVPAGTTNLNDVATATYTDKATGYPVPGTTTATASASVQASSNPPGNASAVITDTESISGTGLTFSVATPSVGSFTGTPAYVAGTPTTGPVGWSSGTVTDSGSVTFTKTVYLDVKRVTRGTLSDTATLTDADGNTAQASVNVGISSGATVSLKINKTIPNVLTGQETASFTFDVGGPNGYASVQTVNFAAGEFSKSITLTGLEPGTYTVTERADPNGEWGTQPPASTTINLPNCAGEVTITNGYGPATADATKVVVPPSEDPSGFEFRLWKVGTPDTLLATGTSNATGAVSWMLEGGGGPLALVDIVDEGTYKITETAKAGWDLTNVTGDVTNGVCQFTTDFVADAGKAYACEFENTRRASITIVKNAIPNDEQMFSFATTSGPSTALPATFQLQDDGVEPVDGNDPEPASSVTFLDLKNGTYTVSEDGETGWDLTSLTCSDQNDSTGASTVAAPTATIHLQAGEQVTCTFTNTKRGTITVEKHTVPSGSAQEFSFTSNFMGNFKLVDGGSKTSDPLVPGTAYSVSETSPAGWDLTGFVCDDQSLPSAINLAAGEHVTCTATNVQRGHIAVDKVTFPSGSNQSFSFELKGGPDTVNQSFPLKDADAPYDSGALKPGTYTVEEINLPAGWKLTNLVCTGTGAAFSYDKAKATIELAAGGSVVCTYTDTQGGRIEIEKQTLPDGSSATFDFTGAITATLGDGGWSGVNVDPGTYYVTESAKTGWDLTDITCSDPTSNSSGVIGTGVATFVAAPGETVRCVYTNTQKGRIEIEKQTLPDKSSAQFDFTGDIATTLGDGDSEGANVVPGTYHVTESSKTGWDLTDITCSDPTSNSSGVVGTGVATFVVAPGETVRCVYTNTQRGTIIVKKVTDPSPNTTDTFAFTGDASGSIKDGQTIEVSNLKPGTYTSTETDPTPKFVLTNISCDDGSSATPSTVNLGMLKATFKLDPGETVTCTFTNTQQGKVKVIKTVSGAVPPAGTVFTFEIRSDATADTTGGPGNAGSLIESGTTNAQGVIEFTKYLVPGAKYQLCEVLPLPGWSTDLGGASQFQLTIGGENIRFCVDFTVQPGETKTFNVDNTPPPGGNALTIGYWKNWSSCKTSKGKQAPVLDQTLALAEPNGILIGTLVLRGSTATPNVAPDCVKAVRILNKSTINTGKKMASDPAFGLAAQLLGAKLNIVAGAASCPSANTAITQGQALLAAIHFNGITHDVMTKVQKTDANSLANTLDLYNNNMLC